MRLKWLTNIRNPFLIDARNDPAIVRETVGKVIGEPQATERKTVADLEAEGIVGLYAWVDDEKEAA